MKLMELPEEVLILIIRHLRSRDILAFSLTCKTVYELCVSLNGLWSKSIRKDFDIEIREDDQVLTEARLFYVKVLQKYGNLKGLWKAKSFSDYGGLMQVKVKPFGIIGYEIRPPKCPHLKQPIRKIPYFEIAVSEMESKPVISCLCGREKHGLRISCKLSQDATLCTDQFTTSCLSHSSHKGVDEYTGEDLVDWLNQELDLQTPGGQLSQRMFVLKFISSKHFEYGGTYQRLELPKVPVGARVPIKPGLFKGTYSAHGLEIIMLTYNLEGTKVEGIKVTGDRNIPTEKVTIRAHLPYAMTLTREQQETFDTLEAIPSVISDEPWEEMPSRQPFVIPQDCAERSEELLGNSCIARFHGFGQIAESGYQNPSFTPGHWIIFSEDLFGFMWMSLRCLSLYHRIPDTELS
ncbi:F-box only protein 31-like isoform X2 [Artemia franciscana]|uniref:F-box only protein 31-like isoform X2 n=1 Tax=Artemia franciscana TaxID=6661 RepID=UPI0032DA6679